MKKLHQIQKGKERAFLVEVEFPGGEKRTTVLEEKRQEFRQLAESSGCQVVDLLVVKRKEVDPARYVGKGKVYEISDMCAQGEVDVVIFNNNLSATQQRNLTDVISRKVIDKTQLILDIFAQHARSNQGKIQVELAQLEYMLTRLRGKGIDLSRLGGGIGTRGPGETKLEIDRRRIEEKIFRHKKQIEDIKKRRSILRQQRVKSRVPVISLAGYTNAGKSTLLNALTQAGQAVDNSLFTTLDPLSRLLVFPDNEKAVLTDTVGFIEDLPEQLIQAFMATLEEISYADIIVQVVDVSSPVWRRKLEVVDDILARLGCDESKKIVCFNKIDVLEDESLLGRVAAEFPRGVFISAKVGKNLEELVSRISVVLSRSFKEYEIFISFEDFGNIKDMYGFGKVKNVEYKENGVVIKVDLDPQNLQKLQSRKKIRVLKTRDII